MCINNTYRIELLSDKKLRHLIFTLSLFGVSPSEAKIGGPSGCSLVDEPAF